MEQATAIDLGAALRSVRRQADLSQRELAAAAGVPKSTVARIEADGTGDPRFRTVERLMAAAGARLVIVSAAAVAAGETVPAVRDDEVRDAAGRRYPAHLDVRKVRDLRDWSGAWWAHWYTLPPERWPVRVPDVTYDLCRERRDRRRWSDQVRRRVRLRRVTEGLPEGSWRFLAELPGGAPIGELRAHRRSLDLLTGLDGDQWEMVLDGVVVAPDYRRLGVGRRLVGALIAELDVARVDRVYTIADHAVGFFLACGFRPEASRPVALTFSPGRGR